MDYLILSQVSWFGYNTHVEPVIVLTFKAI